MVSVDQETADALAVGRWRVGVPPVRWVTGGSWRFSPFSDCGVFSGRRNFFIFLKKLLTNCKMCCTILTVVERLRNGLTIERHERRNGKMAMSNAEIIDRAKQELFKQGILKPTGRMFEAVDGEGNPIMVPEIEQIHTFNGWKELGYKVKKGEHSRIRFSIWKFSSKEIEKEDGKKENKTAMFMKEACWFTRDQVELLKGANA